MGNTTHMYRWNSSTWALANQVYFWTGTGWQAASRIWRWDPTLKWVMVYSTPAPACSTVVGSNSGLAVSGSVTSAAAAVSIGGGFSGSASYAWAYVSGDAAILCSNATASNPTWTKTTVAAGTVSAVWSLTVTDTVTGATSAINVTIQLTWTNTETPLTVSGTDGAGSLSTPTGPISGTVSTGTGGAAGGCTPSGGSGVYSTFAWSYFSGDSGIGISSSSVQNPTWSKAMSAAAGTSNNTSAVWQVIVTDSEGHTNSTRITLTLTITSNQPALAIGSSSDANGELIIFSAHGTLCEPVTAPNGGTPTQFVVPTGGSGSYNYSWSYVSGETGIAISNASAASVTFTMTLCANAETGETVKDAVWQCSVTDSSGNGPVTANINVELIFNIEND